MEKENLKTNLKVNEKIPEKRKRGKGIAENTNVFATYKHKCSKCGYENAEVTDLGQFYSDEDYIYLIKCGKCGHTERIGEVA